MARRHFTILKKNSIRVIRLAKESFVACEKITEEEKWLRLKSMTGFEKGWLQNSEQVNNDSNQEEW